MNALAHDKYVAGQASRVQSGSTSRSHAVSRSRNTSIITVNIMLFLICMVIMFCFLAPRKLEEPTFISQKLLLAPPPKEDFTVTDLLLWTLPRIMMLKHTVFRAVLKTDEVIDGLRLGWIKIKNMSHEEIRKIFNELDQQFQNENVEGIRTIVKQLFGQQSLMPIFETEPTFEYIRDNVKKFVSDIQIPANESKLLQIIAPDKYLPIEGS